MGEAIPRREFLRTTAAAPVASLTGDLALRAVGARRSPSEPRLFAGCCAYSYAKYLAAGKMTMEEFILKAVDLGIKAVDMTTYWLKSNEPWYLSSLRHLAFKNCVAFSGTGTPVDICQADPAKRAAEVAAIKKWVDVTELLGASHARVSGTQIPQGATVEQAIGWVVETLKPACDYAGKKGITLGFENHNHGRVSEKASTIIKILRRVDSPYLGINLDITNFPDDPYPQIEACVPYATHAHIRDVFYYQNKELVDLNRVFQLFARSGYKGYLSAEYTELETGEDPSVGVAKLIAKIKALCNKYSTA